MAKLLVKSLSFLFLLTMLSGCGIVDYFYLPPPEDTAQEIFEAGNDAMSEKDYASAISYYSSLKENFPFSPYAVEAELSLADAYYLDEDWDLAAEAYKEFEALHPRHEAIPYVLYQIGMANLKGYPSIDRPTNQVAEAYSYFSRLRESYPYTDYAVDSEAKMKECRQLLAEHELYVANFYYRLERYTSALLRYKEIISEFSDVPEVYNYALDKSQSAFIKTTEEKSEKEREKREGSWKDWFNWL